MFSRCRFAPVVALAALGLVAPAKGEDLGDAWAIALRVNQGLQSQQVTSIAEAFSLESAKAARYPTLRVFDATTILSQSPKVRVTQGNLGGGGVTPAPLGALANSGAGIGGTGNGIAGFAQPILGPNQTTVPFVFATIQQPIYTGGRIKNTIASAGHALNAQKTEEARSALDLKLTVAEAYVGILRARKALDVARSNVSRLASFTVDVKNRKEQKLATRNEELAAEVSLANARLGEITAIKNLDAAWATYNRYLCRPPTTVVDLDDLAGKPSGAGLDDLAERVIKAPSYMALDLSEPEAEGLTQRALRARPELAGLFERAQSTGSTARATMATIKPQISALASYVEPGNDNIVNPNIFAATLLVNWTVFDGGQTRKRAESLRQQERALLKQKADLAADIALQVRTRWLDLNEARQRVTVASATVASAEENINVVLDRYRNGLSIYTEVLDAENRRIQSINSYFNSAYDQALAVFRLKRAVGDL
jgi:outer membrane protein TolC